jgi:nonribosomal peptide synthetase protein BlmVI
MMRTGDVGFVWQGELYVSGRIKDVIIVRGRNLAATDLERIAESSHPSLEPDCCAAFSVLGEAEQVAIACEVSVGAEERSDALGALSAAISRAYGVRPGIVVAVEPGGLPRTATGKIRRAVCSQMLADGSLGWVYQA